jgi:hypothetical protein
VAGYERYVRTFVAPDWAFGGQPCRPGAVTDRVYSRLGMSLRERAAGRASATGGRCQRLVTMRSCLRWAMTARSSFQSMSWKLCMGQNLGPHIEQNSAVLK